MTDNDDENKWASVRAINYSIKAMSIPVHEGGVASIWRLRKYVESGSWDLHGGVEGEFRDKYLKAIVASFTYPIGYNPFTRYDVHFMELMHQTGFSLRTKWKWTLIGDTIVSEDKIRLELRRFKTHERFELKIWLDGWTKALQEDPNLRDKSRNHLYQLVSLGDDWVKQVLSNPALFEYLEKNNSFQPVDLEKLIAEECAR
jgi:hypothetical protein